MTVSKKQQASVNKYIKNNYDRINIVVPKGKREELKEHAKSMGESLNAFLSRAADEQVKRDNENKSASPQEPEQETSGE
ncbi:MAG: type II toxin-antitoxin system HicB family antitoxin [Clostridiales bacterium]|nr:type II toxin-antitoxin system HicB family antitoxin [Clostridiales bacterium]